MEFCRCCKKTMSKHKLNFHLKSKFHLKNEMKMGKSTEKVEQEDENDVNEERDEDENDVNEEQEQTQYNEVSTQTESYLDDFNNVYYQVQEDKPKEIKTNNTLILKEIKHKFRQKKDDDDYSVKSDELFSDKNKTPILGKSRREKLAKIRQYKILFKEELKSFRIKKRIQKKI